MHRMFENVVVEIVNKVGVNLDFIISNPEYKYVMELVQGLGKRKS